MSEAIIYRSSNIQGAGVFGYAPNPATNLTAKGKNAKVELKWTDPNDRVVEGTNVGWSYTRIVRKTGSYPTGPNDGTVVVQNSTKNQYQSTPYVDTGVVNNTTYYYAAYAFSDYGIPAETAPRATAKPVPYRVMTLKINESDSNPLTMCSYADDAIDMPSGNSSSAVNEWKDFFKYKPCIVQSGNVLGYLNPNDWTKFENGQSSGLTASMIDSGNFDTSKDVMIEFPRLGINISKNGSIITIKMTDEPDNPNFIYDSYRWNGTMYDHLYISAFMGGRVNNKIVSHPISTFHNAYTLGNHYIYNLMSDPELSPNNDYREEMIGYIDANSKNSDRWFYMHYANYNLLLCMMLLQLKTPDIQHWYQFSQCPKFDSSTFFTFGMFGYYIKDLNEYVSEENIRMFGIDGLAHFNYHFGFRDNPTGNAAFRSTVYDGAFFYDRKFYYRNDMKFNTQLFWYDKTGYTATDISTFQMETSCSNGIVSKCAASSTLGLIPIECDGSTTTYYTDISTYSIYGTESSWEESDETVKSTWYTITHNYRETYFSGNNYIQQNGIFNITMTQDWTNDDMQNRMPDAAMRICYLK